MQRGETARTRSRVSTATRDPAQRNQLRSHTPQTTNLTDKFIATRRSCRCSTIRPKLPNPYKSPGDTVREATDHLWRQVRARSVMSSQEHYAQPTIGSRARQIGRAQPTPSLTRSASSVNTGSDSVSSQTTPRSRAPRAADRDFRSTVLERYGIHFVDQIEVASPFEHFRTESPSTKPSHDRFQDAIRDWYQSRHGHKDCHIWLGMNEQEAQRVANQYSRMAIRRENEAKYSHRGKMFFFGEDDLPDPAAETECRLNTAYFMLEWGPSPDGKLLQCPPQIKGPTIIYSFNTKPDCTYWLTLARMNPTYRDIVPELTFALPHADAVAPYFTIEFKKDNEGIETAENQIAVAAALILYNRVRLRRVRLLACDTPRKSWSNDLFADIKHYGITFNGSKVQFHVITPVVDCGPSQETNLDEVWRGCRLEKFCSIKIDSKLKVLQVQDWVNEIHNWGLGPYSRAFVTDIKGILTKGKSGNARISMSPEEIKDWGLREE